MIPKFSVGIVAPIIINPVYTTTAAKDEKKAIGIRPKDRLIDFYPIDPMQELSINTMGTMVI